jgi:hypothetical protein
MVRHPHKGRASRHDHAPCVPVGEACAKVKDEKMRDRRIGSLSVLVPNPRNALRLASRAFHWIELIGPERSPRAFWNRLRGCSAGSGRTRRNEGGPARELVYPKPHVHQALHRAPPLLCDSGGLFCRTSWLRRSIHQNRAQLSACGVPIECQQNTHNWHFSAKYGHEWSRMVEMPKRSKRRDSSCFNAPFRVKERREGDSNPRYPFEV